MSELIVPEGWKLKTIEDICETITSGGTPSRSDSSYFNGDIPWVKMTDLKNDLILDTKERLTKKGIKNSSAKIFPKNTVLIAMYTFDMGKTAILGVDAATNQAICGLQCKNDVLPKFLFYFIKSHQNQIKKLGSGGAQPNINQSKVKSLCIPMPPLETQKKIVQKLDHIFGQLEEKKKKILALNNIARILNISKSFEKKILISAFSGLLSQRNTQDEPVDKLLLRIKQKNKLENTLLSMFPNPSHIIPKEWKWVKIDQLCHGIVPGRYKPTEFDGPFPWITMPDITEFYIKKSKKDLGVTEDEAKKVRMKIFPKNTILMSCVGEVGRICIAETALVPNQQFHGFYPYDKILPEYIAYALLSENKQIMNSATETTISYLNKTKCNSLFIPLAPLEEQKRIVNIISRKFKVLDLIHIHFSQIESKYLIIKNHFDILNSQVLSYAFSGKLVN